jgi:Holliday junction resolvasome RuvABC endonuclease subunit
MVRIMGVDQSYSGFAFSLGMEESTEKKSFPADEKVSPVARLHEIKKWFTSQLYRFRPDAVFMEGYAPGAKYGREMAGELGAVVKLTVWEDIGPNRLWVIAPSALKKFVTGKGSGPKNTMLLHVYKRWDVEFSDDNMADAFSLARLGQCYDHGPWDDLPKFQQEVLNSIEGPYS